ADFRWRATWALFRPRDPASLATMLALSKDPSGEVRSWAVRALTKAPAESAGIAKEAESRLLASVHDKDRRVQTEAIRALASYPDSAAIAALVAGLASPDSWVSVSAAEGLGRIRSSETVPKLVVASKSSRS